MTLTGYDAWLSRPYDYEHPDLEDKECIGCGRTFTNADDVEAGEHHCRWCEATINEGLFTVQHFTVDGSPYGVVSGDAVVSLHISARDAWDHAAFYTFATEDTLNEWYERSYDK